MLQKIISVNVRQEDDIDLQIKPFITALTTNTGFNPKAINKIKDDLKLRHTSSSKAQFWCVAMDLFLASNGKLKPQVLLKFMLNPKLLRGDGSIDIQKFACTHFDSIVESLEIKSRDLRQKREYLLNSLIQDCFKNFTHDAQATDHSDCQFLYKIREHLTDQQLSFFVRKFYKTHLDTVQKNALKQENKKLFYSAQVIVFADLYKTEAGLIKLMTGPNVHPQIQRDAFNNLLTNALSKIPTQKVGIILEQPPFSALPTETLLSLSRFSSHATDVRKALVLTENPSRNYHTYLKESASFDAILDERNAYLHSPYGDPLSFTLLVKECLKSVQEPTKKEALFAQMIDTMRCFEIHVRVSTQVTKEIKNMRKQATNLTRRKASDLRPSTRLSLFPVEPYRQGGRGYVMSEPDYRLSSKKNMFSHAIADSGNRTIEPEGLRTALYRSNPNAPTVYTQPTSISIKFFESLLRIEGVLPNVPTKNWIRIMFADELAARPSRFTKQVCLDEALFEARLARLKADPRFSQVDTCILKSIITVTLEEKIKHMTENEFTAFTTKDVAQGKRVTIPYKHSELLGFLEESKVKAEFITPPETTGLPFSAERIACVYNSVTGVMIPISNELNHQLSDPTLTCDQALHLYEEYPEKEIAILMVLHGNERLFDDVLNRLCIAPQVSMSHEEPLKAIQERFKSQGLNVSSPHDRLVGEDVAITPADQLFLHTATAFTKLASPVTLSDIAGFISHKKPSALVINYCQINAPKWIRKGFAHIEVIRDLLLHFPVSDTVSDIDSRNNDVSSQWMELFSGLIFHPSFETSVTLLKNLNKESIMIYLRKIQKALEQAEAFEVSVPGYLMSFMEAYKPNPCFEGRIDTADAVAANFENSSHDYNAGLSILSTDTNTETIASLTAYINLQIERYALQQLNPTLIIKFNDKVMLKLLLAEASKPEKQGAFLEHQKADTPKAISIIQTALHHSRLQDDDKRAALAEVGVSDAIISKMLTPHAIAIESVG